MTILGLTSTRSSGSAYTRAPIFLAIDTAYLQSGGEKMVGYILAADISMYINSQNIFSFYAFKIQVRFFITVHLGVSFGLFAVSSGALCTFKDILGCVKNHGISIYPDTWQTHFYQIQRQHTSEQESFAQRPINGS